MEIEDRYYVIYWSDTNSLDVISHNCIQAQSKPVNFSTPTTITINGKPCEGILLLEGLVLCVQISIYLYKALSRNETIL
jgi:hypothetical protein